MLEYIENHKIAFGGAAAIGLMGVVFLRRRAATQRAQAQQQADANNTASLAQLAGTTQAPALMYAPSSGGYSDTSSGVVTAPSATPTVNDSNTGSIADVLTGLINSTTLQQQQKAATAAQTAQSTSDASILSGINLSGGGSATITHSASGTTVTTTAPPTPGDQYKDIVANAYQQFLGRAPDPTGAAYWADVMATKGVSATLADMQWEANHGAK